MADFPTVQTMVSLLGEWGPLVGIVFASILLRRAVMTIYTRVSLHLDRKDQGTLPVYASHWVSEQLQKRTIHARVVISPSNATDHDAFMPDAQIILLSRATFFGQTVSSWAVGAHELGHLLVYRSSALIHLVLLSARLLSKGCTAAGAALVLINLLFGSHDITEIAFALLSVGLVAACFVLVDEIAASLTAIKLLSLDDRLWPIDRRVVATKLFVAFLTYVGWFCGMALLIAERGFVAAKIEQRRHFAPRELLSTGELVFVAALSLVIACLASYSALQSTSSDESEWSVEKAKRRNYIRVFLDLVRSCFVIVLVWKVWDQPFGNLYTIVCAMSLLAIQTLIDILVFLVKLVVATVLALPLFALSLLSRILWSHVPKGFRGAGEKPSADAGGSPGAASMFFSGELPWDAKTRGTAFEDHTLESSTAYLMDHPPWHVRWPRFLFASCHLVLLFFFWIHALDGATG